MDNIYIDEHGNKVDPSQLGKYEFADPKQPQAESSTPSSFNLNAMMQQQERVNNFVSQTSPTNTLEKINYVLQGYVWNDAKKEWLKITDGIPERIRLDFLQFLTSVLTEDVRMTNLNERQINGIMEMSIEWVTDYLDIIADELDLAEEQMTKIGLIILQAEFITLLRSLSGMEMGKLYKSLNLGENSNANPQSQQLNNQQKWWAFWK